MRSALYSAQLDQGAKMAPLGEWELPLDYGDCLSEHRAVREGIGLLDRTARARLELSGSDRFSWLQGMVTNDVRPLQVGADSICACVLSATGHLLTDLKIINRGDSLLLDMPWENRGRVLDTLEQFVISEDVQIHDQSATLACLSAQGPGATAAWLRRHLAGRRDGTQAVNADHTAEGGFDIYAPGAAGPEIWMRLCAEGAQPVGEDAAETLRIEAGIPRFGVDMDERTIPLECNLEASHISHSKGCYVGQEIIARIHSRGHTNRALTGFIVEGSQLPEHGEKIYPVEGDASREVGWVTSRTHSPSLQKSIALGYVRHAHRAEGARLRSANAIPLTVAVLPFVHRAA